MAKLPIDLNKLYIRLPVRQNATCGATRYFNPNFQTRIKNFGITNKYAIPKIDNFGFTRTILSDYRMSQLRIVNNWFLRYGTRKSNLLPRFNVYTNIILCMLFLKYILFVFSSQLNYTYELHLHLHSNTFH